MIFYCFFVFLYIGCCLINFFLLVRELFFVVFVRVWIIFLLCLALFLLIWGGGVKLALSFS